MRPRLGTLVALALVAALFAAPPGAVFRDSFAGQILNLSPRLRTSYPDLLLSVHGEAYPVVQAIRTATPDTAVILVPDTPEDDPLHRRIWLAWFLHPRVLLQPADVARSGLTPDYELLTPHFHGSLPDTLEIPTARLYPRTEAARRALGGAR